MRLAFFTPNHVRTSDDTHEDADFDISSRISFLYIRVSIWLSFVQPLGIISLDRDDYVQIFRENIHPEDYKANFNKYDDSNHFGLPYDFYSLMHYGTYACNVPWCNYSNGIKIRTRDPRMQNVSFQNVHILHQTNESLQVIGQRNGVSPGDIQLVRKLYNCESGTYSTNPSSTLPTGTPFQTIRPGQYQWVIPLPLFSQLLVYLVLICFFSIKKS